MSSSASDVKTPAAAGPSGSQQPATETVISSPTSGVHTFSKPFGRFGIPVGGRSTAIELQDGANAGGLWILASTPLDGVTREKIDSLGGQVKYLVAADYVHHLYIPEWSSAYPDAKCIGVEGLETKRRDVKWSGMYGSDEEYSTRYGFEDEIQARYFPTFSNKDLVFNHTRSGSLIVADLLFNLPPHEQYKNTPAGRATSWVPGMIPLMKYLQPGTAFHKFFLGSAGAMNGIPRACGGPADGSGGSAQDRKARFAKDAETVAGWQFSRIIPCHGDVVQGADVRQKWIDTFAKYLTPEGKSRFSQQSQAPSQQQQ